MNRILITDLLKSTSQTSITMDILWPYIQAEYSRNSFWCEEYTATLNSLLVPQDNNETFDHYADRQLRLLSKLPFVLNKDHQCAFILRMLNPYIRISLGSQTFSSIFQIRIAVGNFLAIIDKYKEDRIRLIMNSIKGVKKVIEHDNFLPLPVVHYPNGDMRKLLSSRNYTSIGLKTSIIKYRLYETMRLSGINFVCGFITLVMENGYSLVVRMRVTSFNSHSKLGRLLSQAVLLGDCDQIIHFHPYGRCPDEPLPVRYEFFELCNELLAIGIIHEPLQEKLTKYQTAQRVKEETEGQNKLPPIDVIYYFDRFVFDAKLFFNMLQIVPDPPEPVPYINQAQQGIVFPSPFLEESNSKYAYYISPHFPVSPQIQAGPPEYFQKPENAEEVEDFQKKQMTYAQVAQLKCKL